MSERRSIAARARRLFWYEPGEGFAERGVWKHRPVAYVREHMFFAAIFLGMQFGFYFWIFLLDGFLANGSFPYDVLLLLVPMLVCIPRIRHLRLAMKNVVVPARGLVCPRCLYDLRSLGSVSVSLSVGSRWMLSYCPGSGRGHCVI